MSDEEPKSDSGKSLLTWATAGLASLASLVLGGSTLTYLLSPLWQKQDEGWVDVGRADAFKPEKPAKVEFVQRKRDSWSVTEKRSSAWVVVEEGKHVKVFDPRCPHLGCPYRWDIVSTKFKCPCHNASFSMDGDVLGGPAPHALDQLPSKVESGDLFIQPDAKVKAEKS